jgi:hypothetical protein
MSTSCGIPCRGGAWGWGPRVARLGILLLLCVAAAGAQTKKGWRAATPAELEAVLPDRAQVEKERIETEMRSATGIVDGKGKAIAAVVLITAGYSANGKYSHYLLVQSPLRVGDVQLAPGNYAIGWTRGQDGLVVHFYVAETGVERGTATARVPAPALPVVPLKIWAPGEKSVIQIGRFVMPYSLED